MTRRSRLGWSWKLLRGLPEKDVQDMREILLGDDASDESGRYPKQKAAYKGHDLMGSHS